MQDRNGNTVHVGDYVIFVSYVQNKFLAGKIGRIIPDNFTKSKKVCINVLKSNHPTNDYYIRCSNEFRKATTEELTLYLFES